MLISATGQMKLPVLISTKCIWVQVIIIPNIFRELILHMPFVKTNSVNLTFSNDNCYLTFHAELRVGLTARHVLKPHSETVLIARVQLPAYIRQGQELLFRPVADLGCLLVANSVSRGHNNKIAVKIINASAYPKALKPGLQLGTASFADFTDSVRPNVNAITTAPTAERGAVSVSNMDIDKFSMSHFLQKLTANCQKQRDTK